MRLIEHDFESKYIMTEARIIICKEICCGRNRNDV